MWQRILLFLGAGYLIKKIADRKQHYNYYFSISGRITKIEKSADNKFHFYVQNPELLNTYTELEQNKDLLNFASLIFCEARSETHQCKEMVAKVVINRFLSKCWAKINHRTYINVSQVIFERNQFECTNPISRNNRINYAFYSYDKEIEKNKQELLAFLDSLSLAIRYFYSYRLTFPRNLFYFRREQEVSPRKYETYFPTNCKNNFYLDKRC